MNEEQLRDRFRVAHAVALERTGNPALAEQIMIQLAREIDVLWVGVDGGLIAIHAQADQRQPRPGAGALEAFIEGRHTGITHGVWRSAWPDERRMAFMEAVRRGATDVQGQEIALALGDENEINSFLRGTHTGVLYGTYTFGEREPEEQERILSEAIAGQWSPSDVQAAEQDRRTRSTRAQTPVPVRHTAEPPVRRTAEGGVGSDPIVEGWQATQDEVRKVAAAQDAMAKAIADATQSNVSAGLGLEAFKQMREPGATFISPFYRSEAGQIPLPPHLQALLEGTNVPGYGTIGTRTGDIATIPNDPARAGQLFNDAIRNLTAKHLRDYPESGWEELSQLGVVAGMNPTAAFKEFEKQKATASRLFGSKFLGA